MTQHSPRASRLRGRVALSRSGSSGARARTATRAPHSRLGFGLAMTCGSKPDGQADAAPATWRESVESEIDKIGLRAGTRSIRPGDDVALYLVDAEIPRDMVFHPEGPATFSLSIILEGRGTLSVDGAKPCTIAPGMAVLFACDRVTRGENRIPGGQRLRFVDIRLEMPLLETLGGISLARFGGAVISEHSMPDQNAFLIGFRAPPELLAIANTLFQLPLRDDLARRAYVYSKAIEALGLGLEVISQPPGEHLKPLTERERACLDTALRLIEAEYCGDWTIPRPAQSISRLDPLRRRRFMRHPASAWLAGDNLVPPKSP